MCIKIDTQSFKRSTNIVPDALVCMLCSYYSCDFQKMAFWKKYLDKAMKVNYQGCMCSKIIVKELYA